jgi:hypothetical protein
MISKTRHLCIATAAALLYATTVAAQENPGTREQEAACEADAFRLCGGYVPDAYRVERCLRQKKSALSAACRSAFQPSNGPVASRSK